MKRWFALIILTAALAIFAIGAAAAEKPTIFVNIMSGVEDLHKLTMALQLGGHAMDEGRDLVIFLNVRAPVFATKDCSEGWSFGGNPPVKTMLADLIQRGARVHVCPHCAKAAGIEAGDLIDGAMLTNGEKLFGELGPNTHVFNY